MILRARIYNNKHVYRDIYIDPFINLHTLTSYVVESFSFNFDHCYGFFKSPDVFGNSKDKTHYELFYNIDQDVEEGCESVARTLVSDIYTKNTDKW